jgi:6-phosphofructokinase 1
MEHFLQTGFSKNKTSSIVLVAEGDEIGGAIKLAEKVGKEHPEYDVRVTILGHLQRGGSPSAFDRVIASRMGVSAVEALRDNHKDVMIGIANNKVVLTPFCDALKNKKPLNPQLLEITKILSI